MTDIKIGRRMNSWHRHSMRVNMHIGFRYTSVTVRLASRLLGLHCY